ncbi:MucR family transcriptional regulator [uncultured Methylobacterium sp.]|uniref:MucR family transcriptional regulator n=1 Tax=uncultured Methylobacterium sp. TaxID=157278 RepID=UPI0035CA11D1
MQTDSRTTELAAKVIAAYVARNSVPAAILPDLVRTVHGAITALERPAEPVVAKPSEAQIRASIRRETLVSFEDGKPYKALRRHLTLRGLSPEAYRAKWGLPVDYPLVSAAYSARRSVISRAIGQGQRLRMQLAAE